MSNLRMIRYMQGKTLEEVSTSMGITKQALSLIELQPMQRVKKERIFAVAKALNVSPFYLLGSDNFVIVPQNIDEGMLIFVELLKIYKTLGLEKEFIKLIKLKIKEENNE